MYISGTPQLLIHTPMLLLVVTAPPIHAIHARHHNAIGSRLGSLATIVLMIHFLIGGTTINANASQYCHVIMGIS